MNHKEFLDDLVKYYSEDTKRRAWDDASRQCRYRMKKADDTICKCAIGRHIPDDVYTFAMENMPTCQVVKYCPDIQHLDYNFVCECQRFHDDNDYWNHAGLTNSGKRELANMERYAKNLDENIMKIESIADRPAYNPLV